MSAPDGATIERLTPDELVDARLRRIVNIVRQGLYYMADELGKEIGIMERPCKRCERERRTIEQGAKHAESASHRAV